MQKERLSQRRMDKYNQSKKKSKRGGLPHVGIERRTIREAHWRGLSASAKIFYFLLKAQYNGGNNGKIELAYSKLRDVKDLSTNPTISKAIKELEKKEWIKIRTKGGLFRHENFYRLTFKYDLYGAGD